MALFPLPVYVDRSRIQAFRTCPRYRWLRYHAGPHGGGWAEETPPLPLAFGTFVHSVLARTWATGHVSWTPDELVALHQTLDATYPRNVAAKWDFTAIAVQLCQQWAATRLPVLRAEYDVVLVEPGQEWVELAPGIRQMVRPDALLRSQLTGELYYLEFKSSRVIGATWAAGWERNMQFCANLWALKQLLHEPVVGVLVEGLQRGSWSDHVGAVVHPFVTEGRGRGLSRFAHIPRHLPDDGRDWTPLLQQLPMPTVSGLSSRPPVCPSPRAIARWHEAASYQELLNRDRVPAARQRADLLDRYFPCHEDQCASFYGRRCDYDDVCWSGAAAERLFVRRIPHHSTEQGVPTTHAETLTPDVADAAADADRRVGDPALPDAVAPRQEDPLPHRDHPAGDDKARDGERTNA